MVPLSSHQLCSLCASPAALCPLHPRNPTPAAVARAPWRGSLRSWLCSCPPRCLRAPRTAACSCLHRPQLTHPPAPRPHPHASSRITNCKALCREQAKASQQSLEEQGGGSRGHQEERLGAAFFARRAGARLSSENGWGRRGGRQEGVRNTHHTQECSTNKEGIEGGNFLLWEVGGARIRSDHAVRFGGPVCVALARAACCFLLLRKGRRNFVKGGGKLGRAGHQMRACMCVRAGVRVRGVPLHASVLPALQVPWDQNRLPKARECDAARRSRWRRARCCNPTRPPAAGRRAARRILSSWQ